MFGPYNAVDWFRGSVSNCASWIRFCSLFGLTLVTLCLTLDNHLWGRHYLIDCNFECCIFYLNLAIVPCSPTLNQGNSCCQTHSVHMRSGRSVVKCIQHQVELLEISHSKFVPATLP